MIKQKMREMHGEFRALGGEFRLGERNAVWVVYREVRIGYAVIGHDGFLSKIHAIVMCFLVLQEYFTFTEKV